MKKVLRILVGALIMSLVLVFPWALGNYDTNQTTTLSKNLGISVYAATKPGWQKAGKAWKYFSSNGKAVTGWKKISSKWYYFGSNGKMRTGWQKLSSKWYYFGSDGKMRTGWQKLSNKWYYFGSDGKMRTGNQTIGGKNYTFNGSGAMQSGDTSVAANAVYTINFDGNGGSISYSSKTVTHKKAVGSLPTGTNPKHELAGWYTAAVGGTKVTADTLCSWQGDITLYAHWIAKAPVYLKNLSYFTKDRNNSWYTDNSFTDNEGGDHLAWYSYSYGGNYITFLTDCKYYELTGALLLDYDYRTTPGTMQLNIYCDNRLVHTTSVLTAGVRPLKFPTLDLTNVEQLKFEVVATGRDFRFGIDATLKPF